LTELLAYGFQFLFVLDEKFKEDLETHALEMCEEKDYFRDGKVAVAPILISAVTQKTQETVDEADHDDQSDETDDYNLSRYLISNTVTLHKQGDVSYTQVFDEATRFAEEGSKACYSSAAKARYVESHRNVVIITGNPGMGKTTFSKELVQKMVDPNCRLFGAEFVFNIRFHHIDFDEKMDLLQMLTSGSTIYQNYSRKQRQKILNMLQRSNESICIVMDGIDEANFDETSCPSCCRLDLNQKPKTFLYNLITGKIFPKSKKSITSRSIWFSRSNWDWHSYFSIDLIGFSEESQAQICSDLCKGNDAKKQKLLSFINNRPYLKVYCQVPINCVLLMRSFCELDESEWSDIDSLSAILVSALQQWFLIKLEGEFQIKEIAELAYKGFAKGRLYFDEWDLKKAGINFQNRATFFTNSSKFCKMVSNKTTSYFIHLIWLEFFVAVKLRLFSNFENFKSIIQEIAHPFNVGNPRYEMVLMFLFGLYNKATRRKLLGQLDVKGLNSSSDRKESKIFLKKFVIAILENRMSLYFFRMLSVTRWIYEMRDDEFTKEAANALKPYILLEGKILHSDIPCLNYMLRAREEKLLLSVRNLRIDDSGYQNFIHELSITLNQNSNIEVSHLKP